MADGTQNGGREWEASKSRYSRHTRVPFGGFDITRVLPPRRVRQGGLTSGYSNSGPVGSDALNTAQLTGPDRTLNRVNWPQSYRRFRNHPQLPVKQDRAADDPSVSAGVKAVDVAVRVLQDATC
jgi:hypothetical protein